MKTQLSASSQRVVIVAATDGSPASVEALSAAARFAAFPKSELHLVHVLDPRETAREGAFSEAQALLERAAEAHGLAGTATMHIAVGVAWREIVQLATDLRADVIVVGSHCRSGIDRWLLGSVSEQVVSKAGCAVFVARPKQFVALPEIEAPCASCLAVQEASQGERLWCDQHSNRHARARLHYEFSQSYGAGAQLFR